MTLLTRDRTNTKWPVAFDESAVMSLHDLIEQGESPENIANIITKLRELSQAAIKVSSDFEEFYNLLDGEAELVLHDPDEFSEIFDGMTLQAYVDMRLAEFYDLCDEHRIWVG